MHRYRQYWLFAGIGWVALVVYLSLANVHMPQVVVGWSDKLNHVVAYGFLMCWLGQLTQQRVYQAGIATGLVAMGALMEVLQARLPYRWFELLDALANGCGVMAAWLILYLGADRFLRWLEYRFG